MKETLVQLDRSKRNLVLFPRLTDANFFVDFYMKKGFVVETEGEEHDAWPYKRDTLYVLNFEEKKINITSFSRYKKVEGTTFSVFQKDDTKLKKMLEPSLIINQDRLGIFSQLSEDKDLFKNEGDELKNIVSFISSRINTKIDLSDITILISHLSILLDDKSYKEVINILPDLHRKMRLSGL